MVRFSYTGHLLNSGHLCYPNALDGPLALSPILQPPTCLHELDTWDRKPGLRTWALVLRAWRETCGNQQSWQAFWRRQVLLEMDLQRGGRKNHGDGGSLLSLFWEFGIE